MNKIPFSVYDFFGYLSSGFLILVTVDYAFDGAWLLKEPPPLVLGIFWIIVAYVIGHIIAHLAKFLLEDLILRRGLKSPEEYLFSVSDKNPRLRWIFPSNYAPFPQATQQRIREKAKRCSAPEPGKGRGFFFYCYPIVKRDQLTLERLNSFLALYGFCRNFSMGLLLAFLVLLFVEPRGVKGVDTYHIAWAGAALVAAIGMFYRYLKFFRHYTVEVFMTYAELPDQKNSSEE